MTTTRMTYTLTTEGARIYQGARLLFDGHNGADFPAERAKLAEQIVTAFNDRETRDARIAELKAALRDELEAIRVWQSARGIPADVRDGLQISTDKLQQALNSNVNSDEETDNA